jgi:N-acetylglucosaminyl-diphospho-decaprenol L-rhamnosyltransferase
VTAASIAVAVVNHNTRDHLRRCLESVLREEPAEAFVVDTGSTDGSAEMVRREFPSITLRVVENRGYGGGANVALAAAETDYVLLLNADTRLTSGALAALIDYLAAHPRAALAGPRVVNEDGVVERTARRFPTPLELLLQESGLHLLFKRRRGRERSPERVDWVLGAALALRREAVSSVGGFDESYFMYGEEVDLCLRLRRSGWEIHYAPVATVVHVGGASTSQRHAEMTAQYVRSTLQLYRRHRRAWETALARTVLGLALLARLARDSLLLPATRRPPRRQALAERLHGWRRALTVIIRDSDR